MMANKQITIMDWLGAFDQPRSVELYGLCDDAVCPRCKRAFVYPRETDKERCPFCGQRVEWTPWHRANDEEGESNDE